MRDYVPFVNSARDCEIFGEYYVDAQMVRVSVGRVDEVRSLSKTAKIWIDAGVDGLHNLNVKSTGQFWDIFKKYPHYESIADPAFQSKPDKGVVETFVFCGFEALCGRPGRLCVGAAAAACYGRRTQQDKPSHVRSYRYMGRSKSKSVQVHPPVYFYAARTNKHQVDPNQEAQARGRLSQIVGGDWRLGCGIFAS